MTHLSDFIQILLSAPGCRALACVVLALLALQALRLASVTLSAAWRLLRTVAIPIHKRGFIIKAGLLSVFLFVFAVPLIGWLQSLEYTYFSPVTITEAQAITPEHALSLYEARIKQHCDSYEFAMVQRRTAEIAARINSTPLAIYEAALLECGLNPFRVRDDRVAAGWIQFTRAGVSGLGVSMDQVIRACKRRDIAFMMDLTEQYLVRKWERAGRPDMRNTIDLYLAIFAPAHIGASPEKVVYAGFGNPAYDLNSGLDGWTQDAKGRIVRGYKDGQIRVWEIYLCLERKKGLLLKSKILKNTPSQSTWRGCTPRR